MITDIDEWFEAVGVVNEEALLKLDIGLEHMWFEEDGAIEANSKTLKALIKFVDNNPEYHIATLTEGDENVYCFANDIHYVNRIKYYLCNGSTDSELYFEEDLSDEFEYDEEELDNG